MWYRNVHRNVLCFLTLIALGLCYIQYVKFRDLNIKIFLKVIYDVQKFESEGNKIFIIIAYTKRKLYDS